MSNQPLERRPSVVLANLPSPPGANVLRCVAGGFGRLHSKSARADYGHDPGTYMNPPLMESYAAAILEERGVDARIVDGQGENLGRESFVSRIGDPDLVLVRPSLPSYTYDAGIVSSMRRALPEAIIVAWGTLPMHMADWVLRDFAVDAIRGQGIEACIGPLLDELTWRDRGGTPAPGGRGPSPSMDSVPMPAYHLLDMDRYRMADGTRYFSVYSSRGCSYSCEYCPYPTSFGRPWTGRNPGRVAAEVRELSSLGVERVVFRDQTWNMVERRAVKLCHKLSGLGVEWVAEVRPDGMTRGLCREMAASGCVRVEMGVETGDPDVFGDVGKVASSLFMVERGFRNTREAGILTSAQVMVGLPGETWSSVRATEEFLHRLKPDAVQVSVATPYPGTRFMARAREEGWFVDEDPNHLDSQTPVLSYPGFTAGEIARARDLIRGWGRANHRIAMAKRKLGEGDVFGAASEIVWMGAGLPGGWSRVRDEASPAGEPHRYS